MQRYGFRLGATRFVAGEVTRRGGARVAELNARRVLTNTTLLGEGAHSEAETRAVAAAYRNSLERIREAALNTNLAAKAHI